MTGTATFTVNAALSTAIPTVGIVTFTIDQPIDSAYIEFGRDGAVEYTAEVALTEADYRTLLLGMKSGQSYTIRVVAMGGGQTYASEPQVLQAGNLPNSLPTVDVTDAQADKVFGGFTVTCNGVGGALPGQDGTDSWAFIFDKDGDYVWAYDLGSTPAAGCSRARMSHDGKHLWAGTFSNATGGTPAGALIRVTMDGLTETDYTTNPTAGTNIQVPQIHERHHDFTVLPSGHILYQERHGDADSTPDSIKELDPETGTSTLLYDETVDFSSLFTSQGAHTNYVTFIPSLNAFSFSMRHSNTIVLASYPSAEILGIFNGNLDEFNLDWSVQHGHQFVDGSLLVFNNGSGQNATFLQFTYDLTAHTTGTVQQYSAGVASAAFGDVQRLPNGNTLITYSNSGVFHEIDSGLQLVREMSTDPIGYSEHRATLYGPPPHLIP